MWQYCQNWMAKIEWPMWVLQRKLQRQWVSSEIGVPAWWSHMHDLGFTGREERSLSVTFCWHRVRKPLGHSCGACTADKLQAWDVYAHTHKHIHMQIHIHIHIDLHLHIYIYRGRYMYACIFHIHVHMHIQIQRQIHAYLHTYTHTYLPTYLPTFLPKLYIYMLYI